jgi:hypothetical protein
MTNTTAMQKIREALDLAITLDTRTEHTCQGGEIYEIDVEGPIARAASEALALLSTIEKPEHEAITGAKQCLPQGGVGKEKSVKIPTEVDEAKLMVLLGMKYLEENAPDQLRNSAQGWRDISTAPRDGTRILATDGTYILICKYTGARGQYPARFAVANGYAYSLSGQPTHWQPLPPPPKEAT